jgi:hypothetical protein
MERSRTVNADFDLDYPTIAISKTGSGLGKVTSRPRGIDCGSLCTSSFKPGSTVTLTASADANSVFIGWGGVCAGKRFCSIKATEDMTVTATFSGDPRIIVAPEAHDYGNIQAGRKSFRFFRISNKGKPPLTIGAIAVGGANSSEFPVRSDACSGKTLAANMSCSISVGFAPISAGVKAATIAIPSNDPVARIYEVPLTGTGR